MKKFLILTPICTAVSLCLGYFIGSKISNNKIKSCGNLRLDSSEADEPMKIFFEITDEKELLNSKYVVLKVIKENYISHKN